MPQGTQTTFTIIVDGPPVVFVTTTIPNITAGVDYSFQFQATGGVAPLNYSLVGGALPGGIALSASGVLSGNTVQVGSYQPIIRVESS